MSETKGVRMSMKHLCCHCQQLFVIRAHGAAVEKLCQLYELTS